MFIREPLAWNIICYRSRITSLPQNSGVLSDPWFFFIWSLNYLEQNGYLKFWLEAFAEKGPFGGERVLAAFTSLLTLISGTRNFDLQSNEPPPKLILLSLSSQPYMPTGNDVHHLPLGFRGICYPWSLWYVIFDIFLNKIAILKMTIWI